jgi:hypothetical protein
MEPEGSLSCSQVATTDPIVSQMDSANTLPPYLKI